MEYEVRFTLEEAVKQYATEAIKRHFERTKINSKKGKGNIDGRQTKQILTSMKQEYKYVEIEDKGANRVFICREKREIILERKELQNYSNCGQSQIVYRTTLEELILMYLKYGVRKYTTITTRKLAYEIGAITKEMYELSRFVGKEEKEDYFKALKMRKEFSGIDYSLLFDVVNRETARITSNIEKILDDLNLAKIIYYSPVYNAVVEETRGRSEEHITLEPLVVGEIIIKQRYLREKHNVTFNDLRFKLKDERVKEYKKAELDYLKSRGLSRIYKTNIVVLKAWDKEIENYLQTRKKLKGIFMLEHREFAIEKAKKRNEDFFKKPKKVNTNLLTIVGGKVKPSFGDTEYDKMDMDKLILDYITQLKFSKQYAKEFGIMLKLLQEESNVG